MVATDNFGTGVNCLIMRSVPGSFRDLFLTLVGVLLCGCMAQAHPGVGIVMDRRGNVYYTDLKQVWRITPDGEKSVVVPGVHTHELCLDSQDNLYGEHLWYEGERTDRWGHYVWRLSPDLRVDKIIPPRAGFLKDYSFVRDAAGNMYWTDRGAPNHIRKRAPDGRITDLAVAPFKDVRWMAAANDGTVYLIDFGGRAGHDLVRISPTGTVTTMARNLTDANLWRLLSPDRHAVMGLTPDKDGNVYVASNAGRAVKKVTPSGSVRIAARSHWPWSPVGVLPAPNGDLWILESSGTSSVRVRQIRPDGSSVTY